MLLFQILLAMLERTTQRAIQLLCYINYIMHATNEQKVLCRECAGSKTHEDMFPNEENAVRTVYLIFLQMLQKIIC